MMIVEEGIAKKSIRTSVLICTRNRSEFLPHAVRSVLDNSQEIEELIVVDQSTDERSRNALTPYVSDPRLVYIPDNHIGKSIALNIGLNIARGDVVAMTDDDCTVSKSWPSNLVEPFSKFNNLGISFGDVRAVPYESNNGFIPEYYIKSDKLITNIRQLKEPLGIGANMAINKYIALSIGGFDEVLGPGSKFLTAEDNDIAIRFLIREIPIFQVTNSEVIHYGFRTKLESGYLFRYSYYGMGASYIKLLRCKNIDAYRVYLKQLISNTIFYCIKRFIMFRVPIGISRPMYFIKGSFRGALLGLNDFTLKYSK